MHKIITTYIYPPIPDRNWDWQATLDGYEPGDPIGHGPNEDAAKADLLEQVEDDDDLSRAMKIAAAVVVLFAGAMIGWSFVS